MFEIVKPNFSIPLYLFQSLSQLLTRTHRIVTRCDPALSTHTLTASGSIVLKCGSILSFSRPCKSATILHKDVQQIEPNSCSLTATGMRLPSPLPPIASSHHGRRLPSPPPLSLCLNLSRRRRRRRRRRFVLRSDTCFQRVKIPRP